MRSPLAWEPSLFDVPAGPPCADDAFAGIRRHDLGDGAWVEHRPGWLAGSAALFDELVTTMAWRQPEVLMYGERVTQPRRSAWLRLDDLPAGDGLVLARTVLPRLAESLGRRYRRRFSTAGCNLYRDGADSVAWHGDRVHRDHVEAVIAIVSLGAARPFRLRPVAGGASRGFELGHGDLLVMGGTCQRTWQHAVPKVSRPVGPRLSVTFRHGHDLTEERGLATELPPPRSGSNLHHPGHTSRRGSGGSRS
jgi:alkylated DNA repair dioxygenase AlkB